MAVCSQVAVDPERKLSKKERLAELRMALGAGYMRKGRWTSPCRSSKRVSS